MVPEDMTSRSLSPLCCVTVPRLVSPGVRAADRAAGPVEVPPQPPSLVPAGAWHAPGVALLWGPLSCLLCFRGAFRSRPKLGSCPESGTLCEGQAAGRQCSSEASSLGPKQPACTGCPPPSRSALRMGAQQWLPVGRGPTR